MAIFGNRKANLLTVTTENETVYGGAGNDRIYIDGGNVTAYGGAGNDFIIVRDGVGAIYGGNGADTLQGGSGDDTIGGGAGVDVLYGGYSTVDETGAWSESANGSDTFVFRTVDLTATPDLIFNWGDDDRIVINTSAVSTERQITAQEWNDRFAMVGNVLKFDHDNNANTAKVAVAAFASGDVTIATADQIFFA